MEWLFTFLVGMAVTIGVLGTLVPILPGPLLVWGAVLVYGLVRGFGAAGLAAMAAVTGLLGLALFLGVRIPQRSAAGEGLGMWAQVLGLVLATVGYFVVPVVGAPLGFVVGVWLTRWRQTGDVSRALASTVRTLGALVRASLAQTACAAGMAAIWLVWALVD